MIRRCETIEAGRGLHPEFDCPDPDPLACNGESRTEQFHSYLVIVKNVCLSANHRKKEEETRQLARLASAPSVV